METIRCLVCQGQSIADSDAEMAGDMRALIRERIAAGEEPEADPRLADRALRRLGDLRAAARAGDLAALGGAGPAGPRPASGSRAAASGGGGEADGLADHDRRWPLLAGARPRAASSARDKGALQFLAAALLLALAGYAWQGRPGIAGAPKAPPERQQLPDSDFAKTREDMLGRFDRACVLADHGRRLPAPRRHRRAPPRCSSARSARNPRNPDLWVGLGNALVVHGGGMMSPAAQLAFDRAARLAPDHPGAALLLRPRARAGRQLRRGRADLARAARRRAAPTPNIAG